MKLDIVQVGEAVLRRRARPLSRDEILSPAIEELIASMRETMHVAPGVGLAAPQVGVPLQLAVIEDRAEYIERLTEEQARERDRRPVPFQVIVNPVCVIEDPAPREFFEGCLSLAGFTAIVPRARRVRVECLNEKAERITIEAEGWYARIMQHEIDHLNGIVYIDRMHSRSFCGAANFERLWKDRSVADLWNEVPFEP
ncbi:MAG TPA: peptide deformylase [Bryobacteraceae bacterium]|nr:peptide deformylase [Bryobacteraceae bacterium]